MFIATAVMAAGMNPHFLFDLFTNPMAPPAKAIPKAMMKCKDPNGKPFMTEVTMCPSPVIRAPSITPKYNAAKKPGLESKAIVDSGG